MIKTLSPYYINIPWINPEITEVADSVLIRVYIWNGYKGTVPTTATYEAIKQNPTESNGTVKVNIANWINDFITLDTNTDIQSGNFDGNNQQWVKWEAYYSLDETNYEPSPQIEDVKLFSRGYSYGMEGENAEASEGFLIPLSEYKVSRNSFITIPYLVNEGIPADNPELILNAVDFDSGLNYNYNFDLTDFTGNVNLLHRQTGATEWSLNKIAINLTDGNYIILSGDIDVTGSVEFSLRLFNSITSTSVFSNIITKTI